MLRSLIKARRALLPAAQVALKKPAVFMAPQSQFRGYYKDAVIMEREYGDGYFADPKETAERIVRCIALHDNVKDPSSITLGATFAELGLNELDMAEIYLMLEKEFDFEISEDDCETFVTVNDLVENMARNFYAK